MKQFKHYLNSFSTQLGWIMGILYYFSYAAFNKNWSNKYLISISIFIAFFAPFYSHWSNRIDEKATFYTALVFAGKLSRFIAQYLFNITIYAILLKGRVIQEENLQPLGGIFGIALIVSLVSQGIQYLAIAFANRELGSKNVNVIIGITISILSGALAAAGLTTAQVLIKTLGLLCCMIGLLYGLYTDIRGIISPVGGIGLFFGTFNPIHRTHVKMIKQFIEDRNLEKVIIHPTIIPKIHRIALQKGEIDIKEMVNGMRVYETTKKSDIHVNYFMTGNKFYEIEHRIAMIQRMIKDEGLENKVEIWTLHDIYEKGGFYSVIDEVKRKYSDKKLHGMHGSDVGGMLIRAIYDESIGIIPYAIKRVDHVSATAIRSGAKNLTTPGVENYLTMLQHS